jgi:hypothetical protein
MTTFLGLHTFSAAYGCIKSARGLLKRNWMWQNSGASSWHSNYTTGWIIQVGFMQGKIRLPFPSKCPEWLCSPLSILLSGYWVLGVRQPRLTTHFLLLLRLRVSGGIPLLPSMPSWYAQGHIHLLTINLQDSNIKTEGKQLWWWWW